MSLQIEHYFRRFGFCAEQLGEPAPAPGLGLIVVLPSFREPNLEASLESLASCARPSAPVEVLVVVNSPAEASPRDLELNERSIAQVKILAERNTTSFSIHLIHARDLPPKLAGVGLARKIGMDEALRRFARAGREDGIIACFDADCVCDPNYLVAIEQHFAAHPRSPGCSVYFEHPLTGAEDPRVYEAVTLYELHLRYYVEGLRRAHFPHAFHTVGSSMAVCASAYLKQGGMNKRQAGEDFYFLHKIIPLGGFGDVNTTRVIPSPRVSDRVPFGTGRAVGEYLRSTEFRTYPFQPFLDLRALFERASQLFTEPPPKLSAALEQFLRLRNFDEALAEIRANTATPEAFANRFFRWFDGFLAMKYIHFARDHFYGAGRLPDEARRLDDDSSALGETSSREMLLDLRRRQRTTPENDKANDPGSEDRSPGYWNTSKNGGVRGQGTMPGAGVNGGGGSAS